MRWKAIQRYFEALAAGDTVALGITGAVALIGVVLVLFVLKTKRDLRREDEAIKRKRLGKSKRM